MSSAQTLQMTTGVERALGVSSRLRGALRHARGPQSLSQQTITMKNDWAACPVQRVPQMELFQKGDCLPPHMAAVPQSLATGQGAQPGPQLLVNQQARQAVRLQLTRDASAYWCGLAYSWSPADSCQAHRTGWASEQLQGVRPLHCWQLQLQQGWLQSRMKVQDWGHCGPACHRLAKGQRLHELMLQGLSQCLNQRMREGAESGPQRLGLQLVARRSQDQNQAETAHAAAERGGLDAQCWAHLRYQALCQTPHTIMAGLAQIGLAAAIGVLQEDYGQ